MFVGQFHKCILERGALRRQLLQRQTGCGGEDCDVAAFHSGDGQSFRAVRCDRSALGPQQPGQCDCIGGSGVDMVAGAAFDEVGDATRGQQPALPDDDEMVRGQCHFRHQVAGDQHCPALRRQRPEELANP